MKCERAWPKYGVACAVLMGFTSALGFPPGFDSKGVSFNKVVVSFKDSVSDKALEEFCEQYGLRTLRKGYRGRIVRLETPLPGENAARVVAERIERAQRDLIRGVGPLRLYELAAEPRDDYYADGHQWYLLRTMVNKAWDIETGSDDILIAILDTGGRLAPVPPT